MPRSHAGAPPPSFLGENPPAQNFNPPKIARPASSNLVAPESDFRIVVSRVRLHIPSSAFSPTASAPIFRQRGDPFFFSTPPNWALSCLGRTHLRDQAHLQMAHICNASDAEIGLPHFSDSCALLCPSSNWAPFLLSDRAELRKQGAGAGQKQFRNHSTDASHIFLGPRMFTHVASPHIFIHFFGRRYSPAPNFNPSESTRPAPSI